MFFKTKYTISIIFPAYNEEQNIRQVVEEAVDFADSIFQDWEIIVVNDGSSDNSGQIIDGIGLSNPKVRAVHHPQNRGYGQALKSGFATANNELIFFCDSDLQFHISELLLFLGYINNHDIVIGYRYERNDPFHRKINAAGWGLLIRLIFDMKVRDIDCAFKLFRRQVFDYVKIDAVGAMVNTDILVQASHLGFTVKELPVTHFTRLHGSQTGAKLRVILKAFRELIRLYGKLKNVDPVVKDFDRRIQVVPYFTPNRRKKARRVQALPIVFRDRRQRVFLKSERKTSIIDQSDIHIASRTTAIPKDTTFLFPAGPEEN
jgi:glycosyltransferase involved in cell wall biosynthesis